MHFLKVNILLLKKLLFKYIIGDWGLGIGDWGLGVWAQDPNPQPQTPTFF